MQVTESSFNIYLNIYLPAMVKFTIKFSGRRWLLPMSTLDLLGSDIMGNYNTHIIRAELYGERNFINNRKCASSVYVRGNAWMFEKDIAVNKDGLDTSSRNYAWRQFKGTDPGRNIMWHQSVSLWSNHCKTKLQDTLEACLAHNYLHNFILPIFNLIESISWCQSFLLWVTKP